MLLALACCTPTLEQELDAHLGDTIGGSKPGVAVLVLQDRVVLLEKWNGLANLETGDLIDPSTNFRLASVTKQFTACTILLLEGEGSLSLDQVLTEFFPKFPPYGSEITLRHLLTHTSGLVPYESLIPETTTVPVLDRDVLELLKRQDSTLFLPGSRFRYSNSGYALLALVVEEVSGERFAEFLRDRIFRPLGMDGTVAFEEGISEVADRALGYSPDTARSGEFMLTDQSLTSSVLGDGGVYTSLKDLQRWVQELSHPSLLDAQSLEEAMRARVKTDTDGESYGYGWYIRQHNGQRCVRHSGSTVGFRTELQRYPASNVTIIVLANRVDVQPTTIAFALADRLFPAQE
jgi:CubicO group peptidase (beta-lactamase class C family)